MSKLIWIRRDKLGSQVTPETMSELTDYVTEVVTQRPEGYEWFAFDPNTEVIGSKLIKELDDTYSGVPSRIAEEAEDTLNEGENKLIAFHISAKNRTPNLAGKNWDVSALKDRIESERVKVKKIEKTEKPLFGGHKQAFVWVTVPKDWGNVKSEEETVERVNHPSISEPEVSGLKEVNSTKEYPNKGKGLFNRLSQRAMIGLGLIAGIQVLRLFQER